MTKSEMKKLKVGDTIEVKALHYRIGYKKAIRKIRNISSLGIQISLFGWNDFILKPSEIIRKL